MSEEKGEGVRTGVYAIDGFAFLCGARGEVQAWAHGKGQGEKQVR